MRHIIDPSSLTIDLKAFGARNNLRPTRLEVLDLDLDGKCGPYIEIMLQSQSQNHMTHSIAAVKRVELETNQGIDESLEIEDATGAVTIMRFEP